MHIIKTQSQSGTFSWRALLRHIFKDHIFESAATLSYYFLFSVFPLGIFISAAFSTLNVSEENIAFLANLIPNEILTVLEEYLRESARGNALSLMMIGGILTIYSMGKAIQTMKRKIMLSYNAKAKNQTVAGWIVSFVFVFLVMISFYAMLIIIVAGNRIFNWTVTIFPFLNAVYPTFQFVRLFVVAGYLFFVLWGLYYILPGIKQSSRLVLPGASFAMLSWVLMSYLFSYYLQHFSNLTSLYGSLSMIIALMLWLFIVNLILLMGAYINSYFYSLRPKT